MKSNIKGTYWWFILAQRQLLEHQTKKVKWTTQRWVIFLSSSTVLWLKWLKQKLCGPMDAHCRYAGHLLCFLICQLAPVDYSWQPGRGKLISGVRSLYKSSYQAQEHTQWHKNCTWCAQKTHLDFIATYSICKALRSFFPHCLTCPSWCLNWKIKHTQSTWKQCFHQKLHLVYCLW